MKKLFWRLTLSYVVSLMAIAIFYFRFQSESHVLWPNPDSLEHPRIYTDLREGGFSTAEFLENDSVLTIQAILNSGIYHPMLGLNSACSKVWNRFRSKAWTFQISIRWR